MMLLKCTRLDNSKTNNIKDIINNIKNTINNTPWYIHVFFIGFVLSYTIGVTKYVKADKHIFIL